MTGADPFELLGLTRDATIADVRAARRALAFDRHPDRGGDPRAMQELNVAFEACVAHLTHRRLLPPVPNPQVTEAPAPASAPPRGWGRRVVDRDVPSFTVDALPAETFEALLIAASWIGEVLDEDPPYVLECHLTEPAPCWCRLDLVPDAGGSTVSIAVVALDELSPVTVEEVRDTWVHHLNRLGPRDVRDSPTP
ncbi:MAG: hypothetical protein RLZZ623_1230 [Actinomycetota bacterium]